MRLVPSISKKPRLGGVFCLLQTLWTLLAAASSRNVPVITGAMAAHPAYVARVHVIRARQHQRRIGRCARVLRYGGYDRSCTRASHSYGSNVRAGGKHITYRSVARGDQWVGLARFSNG